MFVLSFKKGTTVPQCHSTFKCPQEFEQQRETALQSSTDLVGVDVADFKHDSYISSHPVDKYFQSTKLRSEMICSPCFTDWCFGTMDFYDFPETVGNGTIIPTDELTPSFFRGLGGSTTKQVNIFTMFSSHGGMMIPIRWCLQALFEDGIAMDARCLMERGQAWRQEWLRGSNLTQDLQAAGGCRWSAEVGEMVRKHVGLWMAPDFYGISAGGLMGWSQMTIVFCSTGPPISMTVCMPSSLAWTCLQAPFSGSHLDFSGCRLRIDWRCWGLRDGTVAPVSHGHDAISAQGGWRYH